MKLHLIIVSFLAFVSLSFGQNPAASPAPAQNTGSDEQPIKVNTFLVNIPVIASDKDGRYISGLTKDNFLITVDGENQPIDFFADQKAPMNVAILIDTSGSTISFIKDIQSAALDFVKIIRPEDRVMIASFDFQTSVLSEFTSDRKQLQRAINKVGISPHAGSDMQDAIYGLLTERFASVKGRKAIIVLTDGLVEGRISNEKLLYVLAESDVLVYPILFKWKLPEILFPKNFKSPKGVIAAREEILRRIEEAQKKQMQFMNSLGAVTGGRLYNRDSADFKKIFQNISDELKDQYLVGFYPQNLDDGKTHKVAIEVSPKNIVIRTKRRIQLKASN